MSEKSLYKNDNFTLKEYSSLKKKVKIHSLASEFHSFRMKQNSLQNTSEIFTLELREYSYFCI